jgi:oxalate decarboxylase
MPSKNEKIGRRSLLGAAAAALSGAALVTPPLLAQSRQEIAAGEHDRSASNPGPVNKALAGENSESEIPATTDHGDVIPIWYSFDLVHRRVQDGGWTRQVTQKELPYSTDLAGVNMRLTAGSYRELHWHTANEWAYMLYGNARVTVLNPDGTIFIGNVSDGDLWYFPAGYPHSIQGLGPDGCEFLLVFDNALFSEYQTFLISDWVAHTPAEVLSKNFQLPISTLQKLPAHDLYIFPGTVPGPVEDDRRAVGGKAVESPISYTFRMKAMNPTVQNSWGSARIVDSSVFGASKAIAAVLVTVKPGAMRELHWHPNASEWQYYIKGTGRMTMFGSSGNARTINVNANDVGYVPAVAGHYIENFGSEDLVVLEMFKSTYFADISLNQWIRRVPPLMAKQHLHLDASDLSHIPDQKDVVLG